MMSVKKIKDEDLEYEDEIYIYHVTPDYDWREHITSEKCWCEPTLQYKNPETGNEVWIHKLTQ